MIFTFRYDTEHFDLTFVLNIYLLWMRVEIHIDVDFKLYPMDI